MMVLAMVLSLSTTQVAFAAETVDGSSAVVATASNEDIQPYGSMKGYGQAYVPAGSSHLKNGEFTFMVDGISWFSGQVDFTASGFNSNTWINCWLYNKNGQMVYQIGGSGGDVLSPGGKAHGKFTPGTAGEYKVVYQVGTWDLSKTPSGTIYCNIY